MKRLTLTEGSIEELAVSLRGEPGDDRQLRKTVAEIIGQVRARGDEALVEYTDRFDSAGFDAARLQVAPEQIQKAVDSAPEPLMAALKLAAENIRLYHQHELKGDWTAPMRQNQMLGQRMLPVRRAGLYVPGGGADYPSTVLMSVIPAQVAEVREIAICTPPGPGGDVSHSVLAAAGMLGVEEVYRVGGAQAVAALAYGTDTITHTDVICGPGNIYVTEAKRQVFGRVGLDSLAGPSEVLIIADEEAEPSLIAADLLAQVEHGSGAIAVLACWSEALIDSVADAVEGLCQELNLDTALLDQVYLVMAKAEEPLDLCVSFSNHFAPEHLQIHTEQPEQVVHEITAAGAVFLGEDVCTAYGDYIIGTNHVLPTSGTARFASALSVDDFQRKVAVVSLIPETVRELTPSLVEIAGVEGLRAHARAAELRQQRFAPPPEEED